MIRRALEPGLAVRAEGSWLKGVPGGYRLRTDAGSVDLVEFRELAGRARQADPEEAVSEYAAALRLWTGAYAEDLGREHPDFAPAAAGGHARGEDRRSRRCGVAGDKV